MAISSHDIVPDSPTNTFATLNVLDKLGSTISDGNLEVIGTTNHYAVRSTIGVSLGKWYFEVYLKDAGSLGIGVMSSSAILSDQFDATESAWYRTNGNKYPSETAYGSTAVDGDIIGCLFNVDTGTIEFFKNNTSMGTLGSGYDILNTWDDTVHAAVKTYDNTENMIVNFGQDPTFGGATGLPTAPSGSPFTDANGIGSFYYQPPTGALALCTANLPDPDIDPAVDDLPEDYFKAVIWSGTGGARTLPDSNSTPNSMSFNADLIWIKARNQSYNHTLFDSVRGFGKKHLFSDLTSGESANEYGHVSSITGNQFSVANGTGGDTYTNNSSTTYVAWCFRAGGAPSGSTSTTGSAKRINTSGTQDDTSCSALASAASTAGASNVITPTLMSINQKAGFSIIKYTGPESSYNPSARHTIPHGLNSAPEFVITKSTNNTYNWHAYHKDLGGTAYIQFNLSNPYNPNDPATYNGPHDQNVVKIGGTTVMAVGEFIMYCWHSVAGYSAFGSYEGNNSATDGPFVFTGFKPAFVMLKNIDTAAKWAIVDSARSAYNPTRDTLYPDEGFAAYTGTLHDVDLLSNGFKLRTNDGIFNMSYTYIYACFAQTPFKYATAR